MALKSHHIHSPTEYAGYIHWEAEILDLTVCIPQAVPTAWLPISVVVASTVCKEAHKRLLIQPSSVHLLDIMNLCSDGNGFPFGLLRGVGRK